VQAAPPLEMQSSQAWSVANCRDITYDLFPTPVTPTNGLASWSCVSLSTLRTM
jgi:hypothetical protein